MRKIRVEFEFELESEFEVEGEFKVEGEFSSENYLYMEFILEYLEGEIELLLMLENWLELGFCWE